jgi:DNA-binding response OmpR family regulator
MYKVLILSRDQRTSDLLGLMLEKEGFLQMIASNPDTALQRIHALQPHLLIIDLPVDGISGVDLCKRLQASDTKTPTVILGDDCNEMDKILLLETGADDYIVKPAGARELLARIRAILRRTTRHLGAQLRFGDVEIDRHRRIVAYRGGEVKVTPCEYNLLLFFLQNPDRALTRDTILNSVWGYNEYPNTRTVDAHVSKLRNKFESNPNTPRHFLTVHGIGYRFLM